MHRSSPGSVTWAEAAERRFTRLLDRLMGRSDLDRLIPPEIADDDFAVLLLKLAARTDVETAIDVGASSGAGSTRALYRGLRNKADPQLFCLEISRRRHQQLADAYADHPWVVCLNESAVLPQDFPTEKAVAEFLATHPPRTLYGTSKSEVLRWLRQDQTYADRYFGKALRSGIDAARELSRSSTFDLAVIDGSEFTGERELDQLIGCTIIALDDVLTFKNHASRQRLLDDPRYRLIAEDLSYRHGYSVFETALSHEATSSPEH